MSSPPPTPHLLYNTTYTLHSVTPLYNFPALTAAALKPHSRRLQQLLRGDSLRGVALPDTSDPSLSRAGKLISVAWLPLPAEPPAARGIHIEIIYEAASYTALLIGDDGGEEPEGFTRLPLLMSRMPSPLRERLMSYLTTMFDVLVLPVVLGDELLRRALDTYVDRLEGSGGKSVVLLFAPSEAEGLKRVEITVGAGDVGSFWQRRGESGFLEVLGRHCLEAMGIKLDEVELVKVATGGFVLAGEGKGKFFEGEAGSEILVLVLAAAGTASAR